MKEPTPHWTPEIQIHYPLITEIKLSPDATRVVYTVREPLMTEDESRFITHLYTASIGEDAGEDARRLTRGKHTNHTVRWSPSGDLIAFVSDRSGEGNIYLMRVDGGEPWPVTSYDETGVANLAWSPDGQSLVFLMKEPPSEAKRAARKAKDDPILWDEDFDFHHIYRLDLTPDLQPQEPTRLTTGRFHVTQVAWMPDGERLAVVHQPTPVAEMWTETELSLIPSATQKAPYGKEDVKHIARLSGWAPEPMPSPDGRWIACVTGEKPPHWGGANRVVLYPSDGGEPRELPATPDADVWLIGWSAAGDRLYVGERAAFDVHVWAPAASGVEITPVISSATFKNAFDTVDGHIVFAEETFHRPNVVRCWTASDGETRTVAEPALPDGWPDASMPEVEILSWPAPDPLAPDDAEAEIQGMIVYPVGYRRGDRCPMIVEVHGGPMGVFNRRYLGWPGRYGDTLALAERGFAVLRVNPRGSGGYGKPFRFANYGDWGGGDYHDIMAGVDMLIERGVADPDRLGIMGWSYGGYMTSWVITQTDRFAAACVGAGVTNLMSFTGTADIPGFIPDYFNGEFWDDLTAYRDHSPLFNVQGVTTPTLIQHGEDDIRVPLSQGRELYNALKRQGVEAKMVIYPRQGHRIDEPRLRIDMRRRPVAWFAAYLL